MISGRLKEPILVEGLTPEQIQHLALVMGIGSDEFTTVSCDPNEFTKYTGTRWIALITFPKKPGLTQIGICIRETDGYNPMPRVVHDVYTTDQDDKIILYFGRGIYAASVTEAFHAFNQRLQDIYLGMSCLSGVEQ